uniref:UDENN domain-containing protein n=1 Tax=Schistosoma mansoni TaxID=6183 RepID=A0A3Q0KLL0_SCHMA
MEALLACIDIPPNCHDAIPLLNLENQSFSKLFKRILKRLEKGETCVQKTLPKLSNDGTEEESEYVLIGTIEEENSRILFARLLNSSGSNEIYKLPFFRFTVRKIDEPITKQNQDVANNSIEPYLHDTFKRLDDKMENFSTQLSKLVESLSQKSAPGSARKPKTPAATASVNTAASKPTLTSKPILAPQLSPTSTPKSAPASVLKPGSIPKLASTPKSMVINQAGALVSSTANKLKSTPIKPSSDHVLERQLLNESGTKKKQTESLTQAHSQIENPRFASMIDKAIDHVLDRIHKGKDIKIGPMLQERLCSINRCNNNTMDHIELSNHVDMDDEGDDVNDANLTTYNNNNVVYDRNQHNLNVKPKKNLVAISPCVSFMMKPVQSSATTTTTTTTSSSSGNNIKLNTTNNRKHQLSTEDYEELEAVLQNDAGVSSIHYSNDTTDYIVSNDNERKHKHKKRKHSDD